jgi:uncharacterized protein YcbK (DUF882 family)
MTRRRPAARRQFLRCGAAALIVAPVLVVPARAAGGGVRALSLAHTHTGERITVAYACAERYDPGALQALNHFLRDHYTGEVGTIDPRLFDLLHGLGQRCGGRVFEVISGFRCPQTNDRLRQAGAGGVARRSLHLDGKAVDVRLAGVHLPELRDAALELRCGGVGYYAREQFVHVDTGRVRHW